MSTITFPNYITSSAAVTPTGTEEVPAVVGAGTFSETVASVADWLLTQQNTWAVTQNFTSSVNFSNFPTIAGQLVTTAAITPIGTSGAALPLLSTNNQWGQPQNFPQIGVSQQIISTAQTGMAPLVIASTTNVANLNASSLNGATFASPGAIGSGTPSSGAFTTISATGVITSTLATGTAPFTVSSTTNVPNLNASSLNGATFASPGAIGSGTPSSGAFTTLTAGANGGTGGSLILNGSSSGTVTIKTAANAGSNVTFQLPTTNGTNTWVLTTDGNGNTSWAAQASGGMNQLTADVTAGPGSGSQAATIAANAVTNAKAAQMAAYTIKGNNTNGTANSADLTADQASSIANQGPSFKLAAVWLT